MIENEIQKILEKELTIKEDIICEFEHVKAITETVYAKEEISTIIRFEPEKFFKMLPELTETFEKHSPEEIVYWFTGEYDESGCYTTELKKIIKNVSFLFSIGADEISIVSNDLNSFISFDTYDVNETYICEIKLHGEYEKLYKPCINQT